MLLDFLDDVFLLHLALETAQSIFQRLTLLNNDFSHLNSPPIRFGLVSLRRLGTWRTPSLSISIACKPLQCSAHPLAALKGKIKSLASSNQLQGHKSSVLSRRAWRDSRESYT